MAHTIDKIRYYDSREKDEEESRGELLQREAGGRSGGSVKRIVVRGAVNVGDRGQVGVINGHASSAVIDFVDADKAVRELEEVLSRGVGVSVFLEGKGKKLPPRTLRSEMTMNCACWAQRALM